MRPTIVYVHPHLTMRSGSTEFVLNTAVGLQERGWPVVVVAIKADPTIVGDRNVEIVELGGPLPSDPRHWLSLPGLERRLFAVLDRIHDKILFPQVHTANYWAFAYKAARPWAPCVWMCQEPSAFVHSWANIHSLPLPMRLATIAANPPLQVIDRLLVAQTDRIVANSHFTAAAIRRIYGRDADAVVYPGVQPDAFDGPSVQRDCILSLGRLTRFKRVDVAIQGYALARREQESMLPPLVIAGSGPELPALQRLVVDLKLEGHVCFAGDVSDSEKRTLYARALLFVATAPREPFGMVCPEAMAAGTPILAPDNGGPNEIVVDGETGVLYRAGNSADLGRRLAALFAPVDQLPRMGKAACERVHTHYTMGNTITSLDHVFRRLEDPRKTSTA